MKKTSFNFFSFKPTIQYTVQSTEAYQIAYGTINLTFGRGFVAPY